MLHEQKNVQLDGTNQICHGKNHHIFDDIKIT